MQKLIRVIPFLCIALTLFFALAPIERACFHQNLNYNEGWNIYNAIKFGEHQQLYPAKFSWTTNNYPMLSFVLMSALHKLTGDYLFTGRAVAQISTILLCFLVYILLKEIGATKRASILAALFCFSLFAVNTAHTYAGTEYTNADDPQMLGLMLFTMGLVFYIFSKRRNSQWLLLTSALIIAIGLSVKHSPVDILVAILIDSLWFSWRRSLAFLAYLTPCIVALIYLHLHYGGPWFLQDLLEKRVFQHHRAIATFGALFLPVRVPLAVALLYAGWRCRAGQRRIILILLSTTTILGFYFGSAQGVSINCFFSLMVALSLSLGLCFSDIEKASEHRGPLQAAALIPLALFLLLLIPSASNGDIDPYAVWRNSIAAQNDLESEALFMAQRPGAAICQDLLTCYLAGKPYIYDPFNTTRLIRLGHIDENEIVNYIQHKKFSSIEIGATEMAMAKHNYHSEVFPQRVLLAIQNNYHIGYQRGEMMVYIP
jgi:4-amino-4-deoxy-L-arabinose transferase-like glycosyltransferase